jgi:hypothetical protein
VTTATALHEALVARLRAATTLTVYESDPGANIPADGNGRVYPYVVVWPATGFRPESARDITAAGGPELDWPVQTTIASGSTIWTLKALAPVRAALDGHVLIPGAGPLLEEPLMPDIRPDRDTQPTRYFTALGWRCLTA